MSRSRGTVRWHLRELVAAHGQYTLQGLANALVEDGAHPLSRTQVSRLVSGTPGAVSIELIGALCRLLDCTPNLLFDWDPAPKVERHPQMAALIASGRAAAQTGRLAAADAVRAGLPPLSDEDRARLVGPPARALPTHPLAREGKGKP
ncbi:MAG: helix-turn-helix transcriptional regulator [Luteimonas sp.]|nr:helix-turn-helix transcriptional regulator [Luteimonas sp.]